MCHLMGTMCVPSAHREQLKDPHKLNSLNTMIQKGIVQYNQIEASLNDCGNEDEEDPFCNIDVTESDRTHAKQTTSKCRHCSRFEHERLRLELYLEGS